MPLWVGASIPLDPSVPNSGTGLPPWMLDVEAFAGPGMKDPWAGKPIVDEMLDPGPRQVRSLATARKRAPPEVGDVKVEGQQCTTVSRHRVIRKEAHDRGGTRRPHVEPSLVRQKL